MILHYSYSLIVLVILAKDKMFVQGNSDHIGKWYWMVPLNYSCFTFDLSGYPGQMIMKVCQKARYFAVLEALNGWNLPSAEQYL